MRTTFTAAVLAAGLATAAGAQFTTRVPSMMNPGHPAAVGGWQAQALFTAGESIGSYTPPGLFDGMGARQIDANTIRIWVNHELGAGAGYPYTLANGTQLTGGRVSWFDLDRNTRQVKGGGLAFDRIVDRAGRDVTAAAQIHEGLGAGMDGIDRPCSANFFARGTYSLTDDIFFNGEETGGGQAFALDVANKVAYAVPAFGRAAFESVTLLEDGDPNTVHVIIGDDRAPAPLTLYIGQKNAVGDGSFLDRNGLARGRLFVWTADNGETTPLQFHGTGARRTGHFVEIPYADPARAGSEPYDAQGFATQAHQDMLANAAGAFLFSRPEDVHTNPFNGAVCAMNSTGRGQLYETDDFGAVYQIAVNFADLSARIDILYDGDDAGGGQFADGDFGLRSPDNMVWAGNGLLYLQEDRSTALHEFGGVSGIEASIYELDPASGVLRRIAVIDRSVIPPGQTDAEPGDLGNWESSGLIDLTPLLPRVGGELVLAANVQAHSLGGGVIADMNLAEGGQIFLLTNADRATAVTEVEGAALPEAPSLAQNMPNPFNPETTIRFQLATDGFATLAVYNAVGQQVTTLLSKYMAAGTYQATWNGTDAAGQQMASGTYFYRLQAGEFVETRALSLLK